jgi:hypothetical protein
MVRRRFLEGLPLKETEANMDRLVEGRDEMAVDVVPLTTGTPT